jgi:hypothetical protein
MVDARAAVELALHLGETGQSESIDWTLQNHLLKTTSSKSISTITGHAWTQSGMIDRVEFRIGTGEWSEATYEANQMDLSPLTPFNWTIALDKSELPAGANTVEVRVVSGEGHSLPVIVSVIGSATSEEMGGDLAVIIGAIGLIILLIATGGLVTIRHRVELLTEDEILEAEIFEAEIIPAEPEEDFTSLTVAQLKEILTERGLPISGKKADLVDRLQS